MRCPWDVAVVVILFLLYANKQPVGSNIFFHTSIFDLVSLMPETVVGFCFHSVLLYIHDEGVYDVWRIFPIRSYITRVRRDVAFINKWSVFKPACFHADRATPHQPGFEAG